MAKHMHDSGGQVIGYEPQRVVYYQLCGNIVLNRLDDCYAIFGAVGDQSGFVKIPEINFDANRNIGAFSLDERYRDLLGQAEGVSKKFGEVPIFRLDDAEFDRDVTLVKLDVEGYEFHVLKGGVNFLDRNNFPPILFECWDMDWFREERKVLFSFIEELGYKVQNFGGHDYVAQHPRHARATAFTIDSKGLIRIERKR
jgi:FkbM family methyltransferase